MTKRTELDLSFFRHHNEVDNELRAAIEKFPWWPDDMLHGLAIVNEEIGELQKDVLQFHYEPHKGKTVEHIRAEAIQSIAMLHRFLNSLDTGKYTVPSTSRHQFET